MAGYARTNTADIQSGQVVKSAPINAELNAIVTAFAFSGGHNHDGSSTEGAYVGLIADTDALNKVVVDTSNNRVGFFSEVSSAAVEQIRIQDGAILPVTDNDIDLGASGTEFKDLYLDGTAHVDTLDVDENATVAGTLGVTGAVTANAGVVVDNITIDGTEIDLSSGDVTIDAALDIKLDAAGGDIKFLSDGTEFGEIRNISNDLTVISSVADKDIVFKGQDDSSEIEAMRIDMSEAGLVGIGTSSPSATLDVKGADATDQFIVGNTTENTQFRVRTLQDDQVRLYARDGDSARDMAFYTGTGERMRIRSGGFVAINTTGGSAQFQVLASSGEIVYFQNSAGTGAKLTAGNQSFSAVSDENKKENIVELDKQQSYDNIKKIRAITYKFKDMEVTDDNGKKTTHKDDKSRIGFIAQDWEPKYSQLVNTDDEGVKSLLYTETTPVLLSALQKAQEKIEALEARITALEKGE